MNQVFCSSFAEHMDKYIRFCLTCASKASEPLSSTFFCAQCSKAKREQHRDHKQCLLSKALHEKLNLFENYIIKYQTEFTSSNNPNITMTINKKLKENLVHQNVRKWLRNAKFWNFCDHNTMDQAHKNLKSLIGVEINQSIDEKPELVQLINWGKFTDDNGTAIFEKMLQQSTKQKQDLDKKKLIIEMLIEAYSAYDQNERNECLAKIQSLIHVSPYSSQCLLQLAKIYLYDLHSENQEEWMPILQKIKELKPDLKESPLCLYLQSHKHWKKLNNAQAQNSSNIKFIESSNGNVYQLIKAKQYTEMFSKANVLNKKKYPLLLAAENLGYIAQGKFYNEALQNFEKVIEANPQQTFKNNRFFSKVNTKPNQKNIFKDYLEQMEQKSKHYIINAIKILKKENLPQEIIKCCKILQSQDNLNTFAQIELVKAYLKTEQIELAKRIKEGALKQKIDDALRQRLDRKMLYSEARLAANQGKCDESTRKCLDLIQKKESASAFYCLAGSYYNQQKWDEAQDSINKALELKDCQKYKKLKFYTLLMKKELERAKIMIPQFKSISIDTKIKQMLQNI